VYERFRELTGLELKEGYGQTEMTLAVVTNYWQPTKAGSMGTPSPGYDVVLLKEDGTEAAPGEDAEICLRLPDGVRPLGLFAGYDSDPATTASVWHDGYYHTHDLARKDADGYFCTAGCAMTTLSGRSRSRVSSWRTPRYSSARSPGPRTTSAAPW